MNTKKIFILLLLSVVRISVDLYGQSGFSSIGADSYGINGSAAYSIGQVFFSQNTGGGFSEQQGAEQPCTIILNQPLAQSVCEGSNVNLTVSVTGPGEFQWRKNGINIGSNSDTLKLTNVTLSDSGLYSVLVKGLCGFVESNTIKLTIIPNKNPSIIISTTSSNIFQGLGTTFFANITNGGTSPMYQWKRNGVNVGPNNDTFYTNALSNGDTITCVLIGANNNCQISSTATSNIIVMVVNPLSPPDTIPFRINDNTLDSFNNTGVIASGYPGCNGGNADDDKFFVVKKPANINQMNVVLQGYNNFDGQFEVLQGNSFLNFVSLACVNNLSNTNNQTEAILVTGLPAAETFYLIRVFDSRSGNGNGAFKIGVHYYSRNVVNANPCTSINLSSNTGRIVESPTNLTAFDNGVGGGLVTNTTIEPPSGPNLAYWQINTAFAPFINTAAVPICGNPSAAPRRVWYSFNVPGMNHVDIQFKTNYGQTSKSTIIEAVSGIGSPCPFSFSSVKCSNNGSLILTAADLAPYIGQKLWIQVTEDGGTSNGMNVLLTAQAIAPAINVSNITTNGFNVNLPVPAPTNLTKYRLFWKIDGNQGFSFIDIPPTATSYNLTNLLSGVTYKVWVGYFNSVNSNQFYYSEPLTVSTLTGCSGTLPAPVAVAPAPGASCTRALIKWPAFAGAGTAFKYRFYFRRVGVPGYSIIALNDTFINLTSLSLNSDYEFYYRAVCPTGTVLSSIATMYTNCGTPKNTNDIPILKPIVYNGITYSGEDFREIVTASESDVPVDGQWHYVDFSDFEFKNTDLFTIYPNPASEFVHVNLEVSLNSNVELQLVSMEGKTLINKRISTQIGSGIYNSNSDKLVIREKLHLSEVISGIYSVVIIEDGNRKTAQLVVVK